MTDPNPNPTCPCGCALAAWSLPWPVETAPWSPAVVHDRAPVPRRYALPALFPVDAVDPSLIDTTLADTGPADAVPVADRHLVEISQPLRRAS